MTPSIRRYFAFNRLYFEVWANLPTLEHKAQFIEYLANYGFDQQTPDLPDDPVICRAWNTVFPDISHSWEQRTSGEHGGIVSGTNRTAKTKDSTTKKTPPETRDISTKTIDETFPEGGKPKAAFIDFLKYNELHFLSSAPVQMTGEQMRWLVDHLGEVMAASITTYYENYIKQHGGKQFWKDYGLTSKSVGSLILELYKQAARAFDKWLSDTFPKVAQMGRTLTFPQYHELRTAYGRANLLIKLSQLNGKKVIYKNATAFATLDNWLKASTLKGKSSKFWLPKYDDTVTNANLPECPPGYDEGFDLPCCSSFNYKTFYTKEHERS